LTFKLFTAFRYVLSERNGLDYQLVEAVQHFMGAMLIYKVNIYFRHFKIF